LKIQNFQIMFLSFIKLLALYGLNKPQELGTNVLTVLENNFTQGKIDKILFIKT